ncbi:MAG: hypothetical protein ACREQ9_00200, partial [Candidatus Binatia bacterium]
GIEAELTFSTYVRSGKSTLRAAVVDREGNIYAVGGAGDAAWPTIGPTFQGGGLDAAIAKFDPSGRLLWSRLIGGPSEDYAYVAAVNDSGEVTIGGRAGEGIPTTAGAFERRFQGGVGEGPHDPADGLVARFSPDGELVWATYIGGEGEDNVRAIHLLPDGRVIVGSGNTTSRRLPIDRGRLPGPVLKPKAGGVKDSWVALLAADGGSIEFLTYFGPSDDRNPRHDEIVRALGTDAAGNIWIGGTTSGSDLVPTPDAFQKRRGSPRGTSESYIAKLSPDGRRLVYFSWLGGNGNDGIETEGVSDGRGAFYVAGSTSSTDFPTTEGAFQRTLLGKGDAFVARIEPDGRLGMATLYGGSTAGPESFFGPVVDPSGNVWATGRMRSPDCAVTANAFQPRKAGAQDVVLVAFSPDGRSLLYGTYLGGGDADHGRHVAIRPDGGTVYAVGETNSRDFPVRNVQSDNRSTTFLFGFRVAPLAAAPPAAVAPPAESD